MGTRILGLATSALILAYGVVGAVAQDRMTPQLGQQQTQSDSSDQEYARTVGQGGMMGRGMAGGHMMAHGMMGPPHAVYRLIFALMDADGDGTISLQEFQSAHERIFKAMDTNKDGKLTAEEMKAFFESK